MEVYPIIKGISMVFFSLQKDSTSTNPPAPSVATGPSVPEPRKERQKGPPAMNGQVSL